MSTCRPPLTTGWQNIYARSGGQSRSVVTDREHSGKSNYGGLFLEKRKTYLGERIRRPWVCTVGKHFLVTLKGKRVVSRVR